MPQPGPCRNIIRSRSMIAKSGPADIATTVTIDYDGTPLAVDIGFIVYNELNYLT